MSEPALNPAAVALTPDEPRRSFRTWTTLWATQSLSLVGTGLTFFAVNIWLTTVLYARPDQARQLAFALSANGLAFALPTVFLAPIAGAYADRHDRRRILFVTDALGGVLGFALAALLASPATGLWPVLAMMVGYCTIGVFHAAAFESSLVMVVPQEQLPRANAMLQSMFALSGLLAPAAAAALIALPALAKHGTIGGAAGRWLAGFSNGIPFAITIDAITFLFAGAALLGIAIATPRRADAHKKPPLLADVGVGWRYILHRTPMLWLLATMALINLLFAPISVLMPLLTKFDFAADWHRRGMTYEAALALVITLNGLGGLAGAVAISAWGGFKRGKVRGILLAIVGIGVALIALGLARRVFAGAAAAFVIGAMIPLANVHGQSIWQGQVPPELQGRVFSVRRLIGQCTVPLGTMLGGVLGGLLSPGMATAMLGAIATALGVVQFVNPVLRHVEDREYLDGLAARRETPPRRP